MPIIDAVYRYRDIVDLHSYSTDVMNNRAFEHLWAYRAIPVSSDANILDIMSALDDNLEFKLFLERITAYPVKGYHMNAFIQDNASYFVIGVVTNNAPILEEDPPFGYIKRAQLPMTSIISPNYGHVTSLTTIDGRFHLFNMNGMKTVAYKNLNACNDLAVQYYSSLFPLKPIESLRSRSEEFTTKYNYHKLYEPDIDVDEVKNEIRDPYPEEIVEHLVPIYEEGISAAMRSLSVCYAPGVTHVDISLLNFSTTRKYINRNSIIYECLLWGYNQFKIGKLSPWCFVGESILLLPNYEPVILNMITAIYSSLYNIIVPYRISPAHTFSEQDSETGAVRMMSSVDIASIKYSLGLSREMIPVRSATSISMNEYDQWYDYYADGVQILSEDEIAIYNIIKTYERVENDDQDTLYDTIIGGTDDDGNQHEIAFLVTISHPRTQKIMKEFMDREDGQSFENLDNEFIEIVFKTLFDHNILDREQKPDVIITSVGASADYGYIGEVYIKIKTAPVKDVDISLPSDCDDEEIDFANIPPSPKPEVYTESFNLWSLSKLFGRKKKK